MIIWKDNLYNHQLIRLLLIFVQTSLVVCTRLCSVYLHKIFCLPLFFEVPTNCNLLAPQAHGTELYVLLSLHPLEYFIYIRAQYGGLSLPEEVNFYYKTEVEAESTSRQEADKMIITDTLLTLLTELTERVQRSQPKSQWTMSERSSRQRGLDLAEWGHCGEVRAFLPVLITLSWNFRIKAEV